MRSVQTSATYSIDTVIIHEIPKVSRAKPTEAKPTLSDVPISLTQQIKDYIRDRLTDSLARQTFHVVYRDPTKGTAEGDGDGLRTRISPIPQLVLEFFESQGENFIEASRQAASHLCSVQTGAVSSGMLVFVDGTVLAGKKIGRRLAILKLEMSGALTITPAKDKTGHATFDVQVKDVTLDRNAKVFKAAIFEQCTKLADLRAQVSDHQRDANTYGSEIANFFLEFLGCRLVDTAERDTKRFLETLEQYASKIGDPEDRLEFLTKVSAEMSSNASNINIDEWARRALPSEQADDVRQLFRLEDGTIQVVAKDVALVRGRLERGVAEFEGGLKLVGPNGALQSALHRGEDGRWYIDAELKHLGLGGPR